LVCPNSEPRKSSNPDIDLEVDENVGMKEFAKKECAQGSVFEKNALRKNLALRLKFHTNMYYIYM
jgi:hypothetical protein